MLFGNVESKYKSRKLEVFYCFVTAVGLHTRSCLGWGGLKAEGVQMEASGILQLCHKTELHSGCCSVWNHGCSELALCWVIFFLPQVLIPHIVHLFLTEIIWVATGRGGGRQKSRLFQDRQKFKEARLNGVWAAWSSGRCPCRWQRVGTRWVPRSLPTQSLQWFDDTV